MKQFLISLVALILTSWASPAFGQAQTDKSADKIPVQIKLLSRNYGDSIVLRWAFSEPEAWRWVNTQGWILERFELDGATNKAISATMTPLTAAPIKAWTKDAWQNRLTPRDSFAYIAAECLLGESKMPEGMGMVRLMDLQIKDEANRFSFAMLAADLSPLAAEGLGLRFTDRTIQKHRKYVYRLRINADVNSRFELKEVNMIVASDQIYPPNAPDVPTAISGDSLVNLSWQKIKGFTAYNIERSSDGGKNWSNLNQKPFFNMTSKDIGDPNTVYFTDRLTANYVKYQYRLRGITPFGELTEASAAVESQGVDLTPTVAPTMSFAKNTTGMTVELAWEIAAATDLKGFVIAKSGSMEGPWIDLNAQPLTPSVRRFVDADGDEFGTNFYRVYSIDDHNNRNGSYPTYVQMTNQAPPSAPNWNKTQCKIDTSGKVTLTWQANTERDLWGYHVYYANQADHEFLPVTGDMIEDTTYSYTISLKNLTEKMYFRVMAIDQNYALSKASETLELAKPDKIAPVSPVFNDYLVSEKGIQLKWVTSSSSDADHQILMRRKVGQKEWEKLAELPKNRDGYLDAKIESQTPYEYWISCIDDAGLQSPKLRTLTVQSMLIDTRSKIDNLQGKAKETGVQLTWQYAATEATYKIFRITGTAKLTEIGKIAKGQPMVFEDTQVERGKEYRYAVKAFHADGKTSQLATSETVKMNP